MNDNLLDPHHLGPPLFLFGPLMIDILSMCHSVYLHLVDPPASRI
jgi:hypothetical protein